MIMYVSVYKASIPQYHLFVLDLYTLKAENSEIELLKPQITTCSQVHDEVTVNECAETERREIPCYTDFCDSGDGRCYIHTRVCT